LKSAIKLAHCSEFTQWILGNNSWLSKLRRISVHTGPPQ